MHHDFWHTRWAAGRVGFHQDKVNSRLRKFWPASAVEKGAKVFVPLCGKSLDMQWLAQCGHAVLGVDISDLACRDFYAENGIKYSRAARRRFIQYTGGGIELWCGDFFDLTAADLRGVAVAYDRAALVALPNAMRARYAVHLAQILSPGARLFLISMDYDQAKMKGPPFSVPEDAVRDLFAGEFSIQIITQSSGTDIVGNLAERGLDTLREKVYLMTKL